MSSGPPTSYTPASDRRYTSTTAPSSGKRGLSGGKIAALALAALVLIVAIVPASVVVTRNNHENAAEANEGYTTVVNGVTTFVQTKTAEVLTRSSMTTLPNGDVSTLVREVTLPVITVSATNLDAIQTGVATVTIDGSVIVVATQTQVLAGGNVVVTRTIVGGPGPAQETVIRTEYDDLTVIGCDRFHRRTNHVPHEHGAYYYKLGEYDATYHELACFDQPRDDVYGSFEQLDLELLPHRDQQRSADDFANLHFVFGRSDEQPGYVFRPVDIHVFCSAVLHVFRSPILHVIQRGSADDQLSAAAHYLGSAIARPTLFANLVDVSQQLAYCYLKLVLPLVVCCANHLVEHQQHSHVHPAAADDDAARLHPRAAHLARWLRGGNFDDGAAEQYLPQLEHVVVTDDFLHGGVHSGSSDMAGRLRGGIDCCPRREFLRLDLVGPAIDGHPSPYLGVHYRSPYLARWLRGRVKHVNATHDSTQAFPSVTSAPAEPTSTSAPPLCIPGIPEAFGGCPESSTTRSSTSSRTTTDRSSSASSTSTSQSCIPGIPEVFGGCPDNGSSSASETSSSTTRSGRPTSTTSDEAPSTTTTSRGEFCIPGLTCPSPTGSASSSATSTTDDDEPTTTSTSRSPPSSTEGSVTFPTIGPSSPASSSSSSSTDTEELTTTTRGRPGQTTSAEDPEQTSTPSSSSEGETSTTTHGRPGQTTSTDPADPEETSTSASPSSSSSSTRSEDQSSNTSRADGDPGTTSFSGPGASSTSSPATSSSSSRGDEEEGGPFEPSSTTTRAPSSTTTAEEAPPPTSDATEPTSSSDDEEQTTSAAETTSAAAASEESSDGGFETATFEQSSLSSTATEVSPTSEAAFSPVSSTVAPSSSSKAAEQEEQPSTTSSPAEAQTTTSDAALQVTTTQAEEGGEATAQAEATTAAAPSGFSSGEGGSEATPRLRSKRHHPLRLPSH
ncbi:hypothetical protein JCM10213v2_006573 [Rhodosporidiobolus nylandii]